MRLICKLVFLHAAALIFIVAGSAAAKPNAYPHQNTVPDRENPRPGKPYLLTPFAGSFEERAQIAIRETADGGKGGYSEEVARALLGEKGGEFSDEWIDSAVTRLGEREDCADFRAMEIVLLLLANQRTPFLRPEQFERIKNSLLGFKFWIDEPGQNTMIFWTENHQMAFLSSEYLTGQMFPDETFTNNGETGRRHMEHARGLLLEWMGRRMRWGFSEWDSNVYYGVDLSGLLLLAEFAEEPDMAQAAAITTDLIFFDIASDLYKGIYGSSHGRAYSMDVLSGRDDGLRGIIGLLSGYGPRRNAGGKAELIMAGGRNYRPSAVIARIAEEVPDEFLNYERHGLPFEQLGEYGISRTELKDAPTLWAMGAHTQPRVIDLFLKAADAYDLWEHPFIKDGASFARDLPRDGSVGKMRKNWIIESDRTLIGEVNKVTYKTKDYMLSSAQDYRAGNMGNQQHVWQATLSPDAEVFTTNPGSLEVQSRTPSYWGGQNRFPRAAQFKNLAVILYRIDMRQAMGERAVHDFTHAFFPKWAFEKVVEKDGWIFGRVGKGYVALYSELPYEWKDPDDFFVHDAIAQGKKNAWLCQMGSESKDGTFEDFMSAILGAAKQIDLEELRVVYDAPGIGNVEFSWDGAFVVNGAAVPLSGFKRVENPYGVSEFDSGVYVIEQGGERLTLDFANRIRKVEKIDQN